ncbi:glucosyltransferase [Quaeritorhiza haematococci]|nr:glucosyltransferase [Quaeritorhiza haematococci]
MSKLGKSNDSARGGERSDGGAVVGAHIGSRRPRIHKQTESLFVAASLLLAIFTAVFAHVNEVVPKPYMDEIFHIPQAGRYCRGDYWAYDPKLTTPPGLYILSLLMIQPIHHFLANFFPALSSSRNAWASCGVSITPILRAVNLLFGIGTFFVLRDILERLMEQGRNDGEDEKVQKGVEVLEGILGKVGAVGKEGTKEKGVEVTAAESDKKERKKIGLGNGDRGDGEGVEKSSTAVRTTSTGAATSPPTTVPTALVLTLFPVSFFFHFLYYTDSASTFWVLLGYDLALRDAYVGSAGAGLIATTLRQTNIIWTAFMAITAALRILEREEERDGDGSERSSGKYRNPLLRDVQSVGTLATITLGFVLTCLKRLPLLLLRLWAYILVAVAFVAFVWWNGGIVIGDKSNHVATTHIPQMYYFAGFTAFFAFFASDIWGALREVPKKVKGVLRSPTQLSTLAAILAFVTWSIHNFTIDHPFLLSDNRHFTFYIWKNIYRAVGRGGQLMWGVRYGLGPVYVVAGWILMRRLASTTCTLNAIFLLLCTCLVLIPTPLLEFRYFVIPYYIYRLHIAASTSTTIKSTEAEDVNPTVEGKVRVVDNKDDAEDDTGTEQSRTKSPISKSSSPPVVGSRTSAAASKAGAFALMCESLVAGFDN